MRQIAISDLHGQFNTFLALINAVKLSQADELYILGDIIGHGSNPRKTTENPLGIIKHVIKLRAEGFKIGCIRGNHDHRVIQEHQIGKRRIVEPFLSFLKEMKFYLQLDDFLLVHAGFNLGIESPFDDPHAMMNRFDFKLDAPHSLLNNKRVIHGHIVQPKESIERSIEQRDWSISIDNGVFLNREGTGSLCALDLTNWQVHFEPNVD
ncbi:MAG: metallophosphoesterase [Cyclobacteriaceae bacterium]